MVVKDFASKVVFLDTAPLIYFIEGNSTYQSILKKLFDFNDKGAFTFVTSSVTLLEVLVKPLREGQTAIAKQYRDILTNAPSIEVLDVTSAIAEHAARLRAKYNVRTPDAIQLATCIEVGADYFLTNDYRLKTVSETVVVTVMELQ
ncbi:type II toxin-antitoxin system VapC family toxin [Telluribacter sp. SYSU D00476]|uniref:type II toxin-antitoxin system VapC family toxin n=1 Tax=Telluribacter sp. SYSU D00476 TaxID=2811430 RepID=UPI001FF6ECDB|nr:type II toxin-antitoxin system VapC family toxin [Telluribacter sp. SYSU D00476]